MNATPDGGAFTHTEWMCYNCFVLWYMSGSEATLACVWHEERFYTAGPVPRNSAGGLADGKPWVYKPLSRNGFTMPTRVRNLYKGTFGATNQLTTRIICTKRDLHHDNVLYNHTIK